MISFLKFLREIDLDIDELLDMCDSSGRQVIGEAMQRNDASCLRFQQLLRFTTAPKFTQKEWVDLDHEWSGLASRGNYFHRPNESNVPFYEPGRKPNRKKFKKIKENFLIEKVDVFKKDLI
jgi:hypothetical protein